MSPPPADLFYKPSSPRALACSAVGRWPEPLCRETKLSREILSESKKPIECSKKPITKIP